MVIARALLEGNCVQLYATNSGEYWSYYIDNYLMKITSVIFINKNFIVISTRNRKG